MRVLRFFTVILFGFLVFSCESESEQVRQNNPFLPNSTVDFTLELARPTNANLRFNGGALFLSKERALGTLEGVYIFRSSESLFFAVDLAEPNNPLGTCDIAIDRDTGLPEINLEGRFTYNCGGNISLYNAITGQKVGEGFSLRAYTVFPENVGGEVRSIRIRS